MCKLCLVSEENAVKPGLGWMVVVFGEWSSFVSVFGTFSGFGLLKLKVIQKEGKRFLVVLLLLLENIQTLSG